MVRSIVVQLFFCLGMPLLASRAAAQGDSALESAAGAVETALPANAEDLASADPALLDRSRAQLEEAAAQLVAQVARQDGAAVVAQMRRLLRAGDHVAGLTARLLELRRTIAAQPPEQQLQAARGFLRCAAGMIDLSGRLRYVQYDAFHTACERLATDTRQFDRLVALAREYRSSIGAVVLVEWLFEPPGQSSPGSQATRLAILRLAAETAHAPLLAELADFLQQPSLSAELVIEAAEAVRAMGLPQVPRPDPIEELPEPPLLAADLRKRLEQLPQSELPGPLAERRTRLLEWLEAESAGASGEAYRVGPIEVQPGDWLLMRNPSPYNLFTQLSPGLFTHVGVITTEQGPDGVRRFVVVDLPERSRRIPATNVETYVLRTLHYVILRHPDPTAAAAMAQAARELIGNESEFDLNFRTERVLAMGRGPLRGRKVHTYCAGLLLLCAQQTGRERSEFFPLPEGPAGGRTVENLERIGITFGEDFISPTGAFFSPTLLLAGRCEPLYDPRREIEEAIFDHFAQSLQVRELVPTPNLLQVIRLKLAEAARTNPLLAEAIAKAANVNASMDLVAAARAAAVVETLDEIAFGASREFLAARHWITAGPLDSLQLDRQQLHEARLYRQRHANLLRAWERRQISPRRLRVALVQHYVEAGKRMLDERFFNRDPSENK
jgi:hypothetical protein